MKFKIGDIVKHKTADFKMLIVEANNENNSYKCTWCNPEKYKHEHGFVTTNFDEIELELFTN
jgi:uncharacterized protein YodC (DUF2158 family)